MLGAICEKEAPERQVPAPAWSTPALREKPERLLPSTESSTRFAASVRRDLAEPQPDEVAGVVMTKAITRDALFPPQASLRGSPSGCARGQRSVF